MMRALRVVVVALVAMLVACGDTQAQDAGVDAPLLEGPCWPDDGVEPKGAVMLGTGRDGFEPMPAELPIEWGSQDGFHVVVNVRMNGLDPGGTHISDPANPRTRTRAYFVENNKPLDFFSHCPSRYPYAPHPAGGYHLPMGHLIIFETCWRAQHLIGKQVRIEVEFVDSTGGRANSTSLVTLAPPATGSFYPIEGPLPGCVHRRPLAGEIGVNPARSTPPPEVH